MVPAGLHLVVGWLPIAGGLVAAVITTQAAAFASARRASRIRPTDALREAAVHRRPVSWVRGLAGLGLLAAGVAVLVVFARASAGGGESDAPAASMILMLAAALLGPLLALPFAWLLGLPLAAVSRGPGMLARANTRANLRRAASVATPVMLAISLVCTILFAKSALQQQTTEQTARRTTATYVLRAQDAPGLPATVAAAARRLPGVAARIRLDRHICGRRADGANLRSFPARGVDASTLAGCVDLGIESGSLTDLKGSALAVSSSKARSFGWHIGDQVDVWLGDGTPAKLRVAATYTRPLGFGDFVLPRPLVERHVTSPLDDAVFVKGAPGANPAELLVPVSTQLARAHPTVEVLTRSQYQQQLEAAADKQSLAVYVLLAVIGIFCAMALVNAMTMATAERAREFALLRLDRRQQAAGENDDPCRDADHGRVRTGDRLDHRSTRTRRLQLQPHRLRRPVGIDPDYGGLLAVYALLGFAASILPTRLALRMNPVKEMTARG